MNTIGNPTEQELTVPAFSGTREILTLDDQGETQVIGDLEYRDYEDDRRSRTMFFHPRGEDERAYRLGGVTGRYQIIDHAEVLSPLVDAGFHLRQALYSRGGARMTAFMAVDVLAADGVWDDPFNWDGLEGTSPLLFGLAVHNDIRPGHAVKVTAGYFRIVCTNGLMVRSFGLGNLVMNHLVFSGHELAEWVKGIPYKGPDSFPRVPTKTLAAPIDWITQYTSEDGPQGLHRLVQDPVSRVVGGMNAAGAEELVTHLESLRSNEDSYSIADLVNCITNIGRTQPRIYRRLDVMADQLATLVELGGIRDGYDVVLTQDQR